MIKFLVYFTISFLLLSIPIKQKQLFYHLDQWITPYAQPVLNKTKSFVEKQLYEWQIFGLKIWDTSPIAPKKNRALDEFSKHLDLVKQSEALETEIYSERELLQLKEMLKNSDI